MSFLSKTIRIAQALAFSAAVVGSGAARAEISPAVGEPILTIDGSVSSTDGFKLDMDSLLKFEPEVFQTSTIWTEGNVTFTGVPLKTLIEAAGATGTTVVAEALNGYAVELPIAELEDKAPIIAYLIDGKTFSRRDKGPLWVVYPYDSEDRYKTETIYAYSIWQLHRLTIK
ncbi:molybdopterin-dependent oxidoreductase [Thioclava sp. FR2]|uniref:molybdopterin-dependent oxidoreductase n=1 Tax=Thioclava sp. FR2 TaxID=3445780 RepID=UPI003EB9223D